jgi:hypothetical protein
MSFSIDSVTSLMIRLKLVWHTLLLDKYVFPRFRHPSSYMIEAGVCYLTLCDKTFSKRNAFSCLEEIQKEFQVFLMPL